jgi:hypothetical protein
MIFLLERRGWRYKMQPIKWGVKEKITRRKLRGGVNWQGTLNKRALNKGWANLSTALISWPTGYDAVYSGTHQTTRRHYPVCIFIVADICFQIWGVFVNDTQGDVFQMCAYGVTVLCYKSEGRWFDSRWCHWNFSLT